VSAKTLKLKGGPAMVVLLLIAAFAGFRFLRANQTVDRDGREVLHQWISAEYVRYHLARSDLTDQERADVLLASDSVAFVLSARGRPSRTVVRVEIQPGRAHPPDAPTIRYYRLSYSTLTGWHHDGHTTALGYYLAF